MERRTLLKLGLVGAPLLALGGISLWPSLRERLPRRPLLVLDEARFPVMAAAAARIVTSPKSDPIELAHKVDEALSRVSREAGADFNKLLGLLESGLAGLLLDGRPRPFTRLDGAGQDAALAAFRDSRLAVRRTGYQALRKLCVANFFASEAAWAEVGYPGPPELVPPAPKVVPPAAAPDGGAR